MSGSVSLWTIGHSNHTIERFLGLLEEHRIEIVADVRSHPYPSYSRHFASASLRRALERSGLVYVFMGRELGGRPPDRELYDADGRVRYDHLASSDRFRGGLRHILDAAAGSRVAAMCSEEDPTSCHRRKLIAWALARIEPAARITHIRGTGEALSEAQLSDGEQLGLFCDTTPWRSDAPVRGAPTRLGEYAPARQAD